MKTKVLILFIASLLVFPSNGNAQDEFKKNYEETFVSNKSSIVKIQNKYGDLTIKEWGKNEVQIKVEIVVEGGSESCAEKIFDKIDIKLEQNGNVISGITEITSSINISAICKARSAKFKINYEVNMPKELQADLSNKYGSMFINELTGLVNINVKYGHLHINNLTRGKEEIKNTIVLAYSDANIDELNWAKINASYSNLDVEKAYALMILSKYSRWDIGEVKSIVATSKYDNQFDVESVNNIVITEGRYAKYNIEKLGRYAELNLKYSNCEIDEVANDFTAINVIIKYGKFEADILEGANFQFEGSAGYGDIDVDLNKTTEYIRENTSLYIKGYAGKDANTKASIKVEAKYSNIEINN
ncbi:MAG: hypothetical protein KAI79_08710 [Bacteroidales bacterium]|nr:hypothetical protein [Bacteroidales bacterium]